jgi:hypothetical protein
MPSMTALSRDYLKQLMAYIDHRLNAPERLVLGGGVGAEGGSGIPPGGVLGQLAQRYVCYDTTEATTSGSVPTSGSRPSLIENLNRIRGGWSIGDDAILERHLFWSTACLAGTSGCIDAYHIPFYSSVGITSEPNVRDAIDWVYDHRGDAAVETFYTWHTFTFTFEGDLDVATGDLKFYAPGDMTIVQVYGSMGTAPVGQDAIFDVNKNGVSILDASRLVISDGNTTGSATPVTTTLALNDYLTVDVDQRGTTTPGQDAVIHVRCKQYLQED